MVTALLSACGSSDDGAAATDGASAEVAPTTEADPGAESGAEPDADRAGTSPERPVPLGQSATFGQPAFGVWEITVTGVNFAAEDADDRLQEGEQRVEVAVTFTNRSEDKSLSTATNLNQSGAADASTEYRLGTDSCGVPSEHDFSNPTINLAPGESSQIVMCWHAQSATIDSLAVFFAPFHDKDQKIWFALR